MTIASEAAGEFTPVSPAIIHQQVEEYPWFGKRPKTDTHP